MWFSKKSARRLAVRADAAEAASLTRTPRERLGPVVLIAGVFFVLATLIMCYPADPVPFNEGDKPTNDILSPVTFPINNEALLKQEQEVARKQSPPVLVPDYTVMRRVESQIWKLPDDLRSVDRFEDVRPELKQQWRGLTAESFAAVKALDANRYTKQVENLISTLDQVPIVNPDTMKSLQAYPSMLIRTSDGATLDEKKDLSVSKQRIVPLGSTSKESHEMIATLVGRIMPVALVEPITQYLLDMDEPLFRFDQKLSNTLADQNVAAVPSEPEMVKRGDVLAQQGKPIEKRDYEKLQMAQSQYEHMLLKTQPWAWVLARMGQVLMVLVLTMAAAFYVVVMNPTVVTVQRGWALIGLLLLTLLAAKVMFIFFKVSVAVYFVGTFPVLLATIIMVVAFNQRFALGISAIHALLVTLAMGQSIDFYLTALTGVGVFVFGLKEIRTRSKLIEVGVMAAVALGLSVCALGLAHFVGSIYNPATVSGLDFNVIHIGNAAMLAVLSGVSVACFALAVLPRIERTFKITTGSTLLELCDLNQPLLKRLAAEAPGTFNHSLIVGTLAEAAGNAIDANGLLCRVGAYYHDIGKLSKPQYFIENQSGGTNRHDKLSPAMSLLIIVGHVKDGIELARECRLPWVVHQFIGQHHGTTLVEYFFHAARERAAREMESRSGESMGDVQEVTESEFRYPGPKPQARETAILMICDGVESIVRSMPEPTAGRIETAVHQLVMKRLMDGQFSECDLTLRDLSDIEQALLRTLAGIYHGRVAYPKPLQLSQPA